MACWDPRREGQINASDWVLWAKFARHMNDSHWKILPQHRQIACICALYNAYTGERAWKATGDRLQRPHYLSRVDHNQKIRNREQRTGTGKYSFVNRINQLWNQLPADAVVNLSCKPK
jgi:hypothetical protein